MQEEPKDLKTSESLSVFQTGPEYAVEVVVCRAHADIQHLDRMKPAIITQETMARELEKGLSDQLSESIGATAKGAMDEFKKKAVAFRVTKPIDEKDAYHLALWMQAAFSRRHQEFG